MSRAGFVVVFAAVAASALAFAPGCSGSGGSGIESGSCGGEGDPCPSGARCTSDAECEGACVEGACAPPGPSDGKKNNGETDIDCGGPSAPPCAVGKACLTNEDCADTYCPESEKKCVMPRNDDGVKNGTETDVDCGGESGIRCAETKSCLVDSDCNGACNYANRCVDAPSCKPRFGGDTCGLGEVGNPNAQHESCCRSLPVTGFEDPAHEGKTVYLDKYEITAGRVRAFIAAIAAANPAGAADVRAWVTANPPAVWGGSDWARFLPTGAQTDTQSVPRKPTNGTETAPWFRNTGVDFQFNQQLFIYVHGHNCGSAARAYGFPTYWYPPDVQALNGGLARANPTDGLNVIQAQEALDVKAMTCATHVMLAAFCHWDGGQLATEDVLDFVTDSAPALGSAAGCGRAPTNRCATLNAINASVDAGTPNQTNYYFPFYDNATAASPETHEGVSRIAAPGRGMTAGPAMGQAIDQVRINAGDEPWMDLHGNLNEQVLDTNEAALQFALKYRGVGYSSARNGGNSVANNIRHPEYRAGFSGGRCMRFK